MTDTHPPLPALQQLRFEADASMFQSLARFQAEAASRGPVAPNLLDVLAAALPAFEAGFAYSASHWNGELTVTVHHGATELGSSAPAKIDSYTETTARLLAGLLGIPLEEDARPSEAELLAPLLAEVVEVEEAAEPEQPPAEATPTPAAEPVPALEPEPVGTVAPAPAIAADELQRELSAEEKEQAIATIKAMAVEQRKAFTKTFRDVFSVPAEAKQVAPHITRLEHLLFIDRYTLEAAGNVAAA